MNIRKLVRKQGFVIHKFRVMDVDVIPAFVEENENFQHQGAAFYN